MTSIDDRQPEVISLWPDAAPGSVRWTHQEQETIGPPPRNTRDVRMVGFSAGGRVVAGVALEHDEVSRPSFAGAIYGALWEEIAVPDDAPPLFIALASNDELAVQPCLALFEACHSAGHPAELHIYAQGDHGFGMRKQGLPSDTWIERFGDWLDVQGLLKPREPLVAARRPS